MKFNFNNLFRTKYGDQTFFPTTNETKTSNSKINDQGFQCRATNCHCNWIHTLDESDKFLNAGRFFISQIHLNRNLYCEVERPIWRILIYLEFDKIFPLGKHLKSRNIILTILKSILHPIDILGHTNHFLAPFFMVIIPIAQTSKKILLKKLIKFKSWNTWKARWKLTSR